jgi:hypothetical protein
MQSDRQKYNLAVKLQKLEAERDGLVRLLAEQRLAFAELRQDFAQARAHLDEIRRALRLGSASPRR